MSLSRCRSALNRGGCCLAPVEKGHRGKAAQAKGPGEDRHKPAHEEGSHEYDRRPCGPLPPGVIRHEYGALDAIHCAHATETNGQPCCQGRLPGSALGKGTDHPPMSRPAPTVTIGDPLQRQMKAPDVRNKRAYESPAAGDGYRVLVDRIWPRGVKREDARIDEWARELAPSSELRRWFSHDPKRFEEFRRRYRDELSAQREQLDELRRRARSEPVTLVYAARDQEHNNAVVLAELLRGRQP